MRFTKKFSSYYDFLEKIGEDIPVFSKEEQNVISSIYSFLPLVRLEEYLIIKDLLEGAKTKEEIRLDIKMFDGFKESSFEHALKNLLDEFYYTRPISHVKLLNFDHEKYSLNFTYENPSFKDWIISLLEYGLARYQIEFYGENGLVKLYYPYSSSASLLALNSNNLFRMTGICKVNGERVIYIDLKKDDQNLEHLKYKDKFLSSLVLQWESQTSTTLSNKKGEDLINNPYSHIFVRKCKREDGADMPFYYLGKGKLTNARVSTNTKMTLLFDIILDNEVPETYFDDFGIERNNEESN